MKKYCIYILLALFSTLEAQAQKSYLKDALEKFTKDKSITFVCSGEKSEPTDSILWSWKQYAFKANDEAKFLKEIERITMFYNKDCEEPSTDFSYIVDGSNATMENWVTFLFNFGNQNKMIGSTFRNSVIINRQKMPKPGLRRVCAIEWDNNYETEGCYKGNVYFIEGTAPLNRHFPQREMRLMERTPFCPYQHSNRLDFYAKKACKDGLNEAIAMGTYSVVEDIIQKKCKKEITFAKTTLDGMLLQCGDLKTSDFDSETIGRIRNTLTKAMQKLNTINDTIVSLNATHTPIEKNSSSLTLQKDEKERENEVLAEKLKEARHDLKGNFEIIGTRDPELWDRGYYISFQDEAGIFGDPILVPTKGTRFSYKHDLKDITMGRIRALMKDGTICTAWITIPFVPGEIAELQVHNGYYSLDGSSFYQQWTKEEHKQLSAMPAEWLTRYALNNINSPGIICHIFYKHLIKQPAEQKKIYKALPKSIYNNHFGRFIKKYMD